jgi:acetoacetyl-CoA synthetase
MMWNTLVGALVLGSAIVMIDGNPNFPDDRELWRVAERTRTTVFGMAPGGIMAAVKSGFDPASELDLSTVKEICSAGAPLPAAGYGWVVDTFGPGVLLNVGCGGTDVCTGILHATPLTPVYGGEMSSASLGFAAKAFDSDGNEVFDETGELVITEPVPSMPVTFWGADGEQRYRDAYFDKFPGVWRHGDWARFDSAGGVVVTGRSDATLNRGGVRLGTADFYTVVDALPGVKDCLVIHLEDPDGGMGKLVLFVQTDDGVELDDAMVATIRTELRTELSPRHIPDQVVGISAVPLGRTGKKLEVPVKRIVQGADPASVVTPGSLAEPHSLDDIVAYAAASQEVDA